MQTQSSFIAEFIGRNGCRIGLLALALAGALPSGALATPRDSVTFTNIQSQGNPNTDSGTTPNVITPGTLTGGYVARSIRVSGALRADVSGTQQHEARILVTPTVGKPFVLMPSRITTSESPGATHTYTDCVFPLNTPIIVGAGDTWTFRFFEVKANSTTRQDATWTSIQITLDDDFALPGTTQALAHDASGVYQEAEPNDDAFLTPNVINGMLPGESIHGTIAGSTVVVDPGTPSATPDFTADTFVIRTAPLAPTNPPTIYRYQLTLDSTDGEIIGSGILGTAQNTYSQQFVIVPPSGQNYIVVGGGKVQQFNGSVESQGVQAAYGVSSLADPHARINQWDGFGRGEAVAYRVGYGGSVASPHPYTVTLSRSTVTPIDAGAPLLPGSITITASIHDTTSPNAYAWRCVLFDSTLHEIPDAQSRNDCAFSTSTPMTRTLEAGTYYLAVGTSPSSMTSQTAPLFDNCNAYTEPLPFYPDAVMNSSNWGNLRYVLTLTDQSDVQRPVYCPGSVPTDPCVQVGTQDIMWYRFTVGSAQATCCRGATCAVIAPSDCVVASGTAGALINAAATCNSGSTSTPCCHADYNKINAITVQDIFDFLSDWFAGSPYARVGGDGSSGGLAVQDIFNFLSAWFAGGC